MPSAPIVLRDANATLNYDPATRFVSITSGADKGKRNSAVLNLPLVCILNIETREERHTRQMMRKAADTSTDSGVGSSGLARRGGSSSSGVGEDIGCFPSRSKQQRGAAMVPTSDEPSVAAGAAAAATAAGRTWYWMHYLPPKHTVVKTMSFSSRDGDDAAVTLACVVSLILNAAIVPLPHHHHHHHHHATAAASSSAIEAREPTTATAAATAESAPSSSSPSMTTPLPLPPPRELIVFLSPMSGSGKAVQMWAKEVVPILHYSRHAIRVIETTHRKHCTEHVADLNNAFYTRSAVVVAAGGDGMIHEAVNGIYQRRTALEQKKAALLAAGDEAAAAAIDPTDVPLVATLPAGSGCGLAKQCGLLKSVEAAVALVHLNTTLLDLMHIRFVPTPRAERPSAPASSAVAAATASASGARELVPGPEVKPIVAFLNVAFAITNEIDRGSEKWRWMGNARFTAHALGLIASGIPTYQCRVRYVPWRSRIAVGSSIAPGGAVTKVTKAHKMPVGFPACTACDSCAFCNAHDGDAPTTTTVDDDAAVDPEAPIPDDSPEWVEIPEKRFTILMMNNLVWAGRDMAVAPLAHARDGSIDLVYSGPGDGNEDGKKSAPRSDFVKIFLDLEAGKHVDHPVVHYVKARAIEVLPMESFVMADGEVVDLFGTYVTPLRNAVRIVRAL